MPRTHRAWFRAAAVFGSVTLALVAGEVVVRLVEAQSPAQPAVKIHPVAADSFMNPLGLRDRWDAVPQDPDLLRIAFLGDSFTYGLGVDSAQTFVRRTGELLNQRRQGPCVTVNLGRPGIDLITAWTTLNQVRDGLRPNVVVHVLSQDDLDVDCYEQGHAIERLVTERTWPCRYSRLFDRIETALRWSQAGPRIVNHLQGGATPEERRRAWTIAEHQIRAIKRLTEEAGGVYALVRFPCLRWMADARPYPLTDIHSKTAKLARDLGIAYLDLLETFRGRDPAAMCLATTDDHPTAEAHELAAEAIASWLNISVLPRAQTQPASQPTITRSPQDVIAAEIRQYERVLKLDPTCRSARSWLDQADRRREIGNCP